eukprot:scaffold2295_cov354-Prasinococcus_capsulatus_cf.AAC.13
MRHFVSAAMTAPPSRTAETRCLYHMCALKDLQLCMWETGIAAHSTSSSTRSIGHAPHCRGQRARPPCVQIALQRP